MRFLESCYAQTCEGSFSKHNAVECQPDQTLALESSRKAHAIPQVTAIDDSSFSRIDYLDMTRNHNDEWDAGRAV